MNCRGNPVSIHMGRCEIISVGRERASVQERERERERERQRQRGEDLGVMKEGKERQGPCYFPDAAAAAAAKSLQLCLTLCNPRDSSPSGSPIPGIL